MVEDVVWLHQFESWNSDDESIADICAICSDLRVRHPQAASSSAAQDGGES